MTEREEEDLEGLDTRYMRYDGTRKTFLVILFLIVVITPIIILGFAIPLHGDFNAIYFSTYFGGFGFFFLVMAGSKITLLVLRNRDLELIKQRRRSRISLQPIVCTVNQTQQTVIQHTDLPPPSYESIFQKI